MGTNNKNGRRMRRRRRRHVSNERLEQAEA